MGGGGRRRGGGWVWGAYSALQSTLLYMKRLNKTESPIFVLLCAVWSLFPRPTFDFIAILLIYRLVMMWSFTYNSIFSFLCFPVFQLQLKWPIPEPAIPISSPWWDIWRSDTRWYWYRMVPMATTTIFLEVCWNDDKDKELDDTWLRIWCIYWMFASKK